MTTTENSPPTSHQYWWFQLVFWIAYWVLNLIFAHAYGYSSALVDGVFFVLSLLMFAVTHSYRWLYRQYGQRITVGVICLQLLWLLPLSALLLQALFAALIYVGIELYPSPGRSLGTFSTGAFVGYVMNTTIILVLWSVIALLRAEWGKRRTAERDYWQNEIRLREVELQVLRSQINSHFLFNALNNIRALMLEDVQAARQALADLATLLRGLMHSDALATVRLRDEIDLVKGYLALEALQFERRLTFEIVVEPRLLDAQLPPLLLQTLVENAIKHGIARRNGGGHVRISAKPASATQWHLQVENPPAQLPAGHKGSGIGLKNASERLRAVFGDNCSLDLVCLSTVTATATLPL
jgi:signal transduction histidine kinase